MGIILVVGLVAFMIWTVETLGDIRRDQSELMEALRRVEAKLTEPVTQQTQ